MSDSKSISFRPAQIGDAAQVFAWRQKPHVALWWNIHEGGQTAFSWENFEREWRDELASDWQWLFLITLAEKPIGFLQCYHAASAGQGWWPDESDAAHGLDLFIGEEDLLGQGLGPQIVRAFAARLFARPDVQSLITDPDPRNRRSVRCFEKAGFVAEGEIWTPDGRSWLMRLRREHWNSES